MIASMSEKAVGLLPRGDGPGKPFVVTKEHPKGCLLLMLRLINRLSIVWRVHTVLPSQSSLLAALPTSIYWTGCVTPSGLRPLSAMARSIRQEPPRLPFRLALPSKVGQCSKRRLHRYNGLHQGRVQGGSPAADAEGMLPCASLC